MDTRNSARTPWWAWSWPLAALSVLCLHITFHPGGLFALAEGFALITTVFSAVYHAEVVAHSLGFGTLVLALAVTIIEVALIVPMISGAVESAVLARDTVLRPS